MGAAGVGPVEVTTTVTNNSGGSVVFNYADLLSADLSVTSDASTKLWRFARASVRSGSDSFFTTGALQTTLAATTTVNSTVSNDIYAGSYVMPFVMLDVGAVHGLYLGYENDFGLINTATYGNANAIRTWAYMYSSSSITEANGATLTIPGWFVGTYTGNIEVGSNHMKAWFYANKMTPTIRPTATSRSRKWTCPATPPARRRPSSPITRSPAGVWNWPRKTTIGPPMPATAAPVWRRLDAELRLVGRHEPGHTGA